MVSSTTPFDSANVADGFDVNEDVEKFANDPGQHVSGQRERQWTILDSSQLDVVENQPDGPVSDEPKVGVKAK